MLTRRRPSPAPLATFGAAALLAAASGCHMGSGENADSKAQSMIKCEAVSSPEVVVSPPTVTIHHGVMEVAGTIHRQPGVTGILDGRVDIDMLGPDGMRLDQPLHAPMVPNTVPVDASQSARYAPAPFGYVPPPGSTLRAHYVNRKTAKLENLQEGIRDVNGNGGHTGDDVRSSQENGSMPTNPAGDTR